MTNVLLPTDFSPNARNAMFYALSLFGSKSSHFVLFNAFYIPYIGYDLPPTMNEFARENANKSFLDLLKRIKNGYPGKTFSIETEFRLEYAEEAIAKIARQKKTDIIVMGTQGSSGFLDDLIGSITTGLIKRVTCPVLAIPEKCNYTPPTKIVLALDPGRDDEISGISLEPLLQMAREYNAEIMVLYVIEDQENTQIKRDKLEARLEGYNYSCNTLYFEKPAEGIDKFIKANHASMLALVRHNYSLFEKLFHKSITKKMALHSKIPLLVLHSET